MRSLGLKWDMQAAWRGSRDRVCASPSSARGISGLSAAWLLSRRHDVTVFEQRRAHRRPLQHGRSSTAAGRQLPVDTGFIVFNEPTYPNLTALFEHLGVPTRAARHVVRGLARRRRAGILRRNRPGGLFAQRGNVLSPALLVDAATICCRFYREAPRARRARDVVRDDARRLSRAQRATAHAFRDDHLLPMAAAIWSAPAAACCDYPASVFIRFYDNHGLLKLRDRPLGAPSTGGSRTYVGG